MIESLPLRMHEVDFDKLLEVLEVVVYGLTKVRLEEGCRVTLPATDACIICMGLRGEIQLLTQESPATMLGAGDTIVLPAGRALSLGIAKDAERCSVLDLSLLRFNLGDKETTAWPGIEGHGQIEVMCGYFRGTFASTIDIFSGMPAPIVERFGCPSRVSACLEGALEELHGCELGGAAMATALFKQALICIFRRRMKSTDAWRRSVALFRDPQIAPAFRDMVARPGAKHTVAALADKASLSRSAFMARFYQTMGNSPMAVLRLLRMQKALQLLATETPALAQIAHLVGYWSQSGFVRAFKQVYGRNPCPEEC